MDTSVPKPDERNSPRSPQALDLHSHRYGDEIVREGDESRCFYVILSGQVRISKRGKLIRFLEDQDVFGLEGILCKKAIPYTAKAMSKTRIASYGPEALDHFIRENPRMTESILNSTLQQLIQTSGNLAQDPGSFRLEEARVDFYQDGETIIHEGSPETDLFRLVSTQGGLRVIKGGKEVSRIDKPGEFFGEMAGLMSVPRQATVVSVGESLIERYGFEDFEVIIRDYPEVALEIMKTLVTRLVELTKKYTEVSW
jgi:CRP-like cAMP-binding protein